MALHGEVAGVEEVFKGISRKFQQLVQQEGLNGDEVEDMMSVLKKEKENLVSICRYLSNNKYRVYLHLVDYLLLNNYSLYVPPSGRVLL